MRIRKGNINDHKALLEMIKLLAEYEKASKEVTVNLQQMLEETNYFNFLVAEKNSEIVGIALYYHIYSTWKGKSLYLEDLIVREDYRKQGIGSLLMDEIFKIASLEKCKRIKWQVLDWNTPAVNFYKKMGANISEEWFNCDFYENDIQNYLEERKLI